MVGKVTRKFRIHNAQQFLEQFDEQINTEMYLFIGRSMPWEDDTNPPIPIDKVEVTDYDIWNEMFALKKITAGDVSLAVPRINWTSGEIYDQYQSNTEFASDSNFYVLTDDYNVYKCLYNAVGSTSTIKPSSQSTSAFNTSDGYTWKFMYSITPGDVLKFLTTLYMPVKYLTANNGSLQWDVQQAAANGAIEVITVQHGGLNYIWNFGNPQDVTDGSTIQLASNALANNDIYNGSTIYIASGSGAGQIRTIVNYDGTNKIVTTNTAFSPVPNTSSGYILSPKVTVVGDGSGVLAYCNVHSGTGAINKVTVLNKGENYSFANVSILANTGSGAVAVAQLSPRGGHGANPVEELFGHNLVMNAKLTGSESNTFITDNDYRIIGILRDPLLADGNEANSASYSQATKLVLTSANGTFTSDELITGVDSEAEAYMIEYANSTTLAVYGNKKEFSASELISGNTSGASAVVDSIVEPSLMRFSGDIMYYEFRTPIMRDPTQQEDVKVILRF